MPFLMYGLAPGFSETPEKFDLAVLLTRITMPYLLCMSLVALMSGVLNSFGKFVESSSVSIVLNGVMMVGHAHRHVARLPERADGRRHPGVGRVRRRHPAAVAADGRPAAQQHLAEAAPAAHDRRHAPPDHVSAFRASSPAA